MAKAASSTVEAGARASRQYWIQKESPPSFFSWPGWLWLLLLLPLLLWGIFVTAPHIERDIEENVFSRLSDQNNQLGLSDVVVSADGQNVGVSALGPQASESWAHTVAQATKCDTWLADDMTCPIDVNVDLEQAAVVAAAAPIVVEAQPEPEPVVVDARAHNFTAVRSEQSVVLTGEVPADDIRQSIGDQYQSQGLTVDNQLTVSAENSAHDDNWAGSQAVALLASAERGNVRWVDGVLSSSVLVKSENESATRGVFQQADFTDRFGSLDVQVLETVNRCDQEFAQLLSENTIQFKISSADISAQSNALLEQVAELAGSCGLGLDIEGHTDSVGDLEMNKALSLARANSVIAALAATGADPSGFTAYGYGPDNPIADNDTPEGRRMNRRIEIRATKIN